VGDGRRVANCACDLQRVRQELIRTSDVKIPSDPTQKNEVDLARYAKHDLDPYLICLFQLQPDYFRVDPTRLQSPVTRANLPWSVSPLIFPSSLHRIGCCCRPSRQRQAYRAHNNHPCCLYVRESILAARAGGFGVSTVCKRRL
jgi:hypothetical protein